MTLRDLLRVSLGNLWRRKLRSGLTTAGVVIAIGAFVTMLSLGAGNQRMVTREFEESGLLSTVQVYPPSEEDDGEIAPLDDGALAELALLPGVQRAFPFDDFDVEVALGDRTASARAQARPPGAETLGLYTRLERGEALAANDDEGVLVAGNFLDELGLDDPDSLLGRDIRISVRSVSPDSGLARLFQGLDDRLRERIGSVHPDSLRSLPWLETQIRHEASEAARRFFDGYLNAQIVTEDTLTVRGVLRGRERRTRFHLLIPVSTARRFAEAGPGGDPAKILPALLGGTLFLPPDGETARSYRQATLVLGPLASHPAVVDSVEARGFRAFSYAAEFSQIRRALMFFQLGLASVGLVALMTAALGIVNTMVMSVSERRREIGVFKSLGAEDRDVRRLFLVESGTIGAIGSGLGVLLGWAVARLGAVVAQEIMRRQDVPPMDMFATPPWLVALAIGFGTLVAVVAGWLPAARAARVDPVRALRSE